jgi:hypothetical protein
MAVRRGCLLLLPQALPFANAAASCSCPQDSIAYLRSLGAVRDRCHAVWSLALEGKTSHFALNLAKLGGECGPPPPAPGRPPGRGPASLAVTAFTPQ